MMTTIRKTIRPSSAFVVIWEPHLLPTTSTLTWFAGVPVVFDRVSSTLVWRSGLVIDSVWIVADLACGGRLSVKIWTCALGTPACWRALVNVGTVTFFDRGTLKIEPPRKSIPYLRPRMPG